MLLLNLDNSEQVYRVELMDEDLQAIEEIYTTNPGNNPMQLGPNERSFDLTAMLQDHEGQEVCFKFTQVSTLFAYEYKIWMILSLMMVMS